MGTQTSAVLFNINTTFVSKRGTHFDIIFMKALIMFKRGFRDFDTLKLMLMLLVFKFVKGYVRRRDWQ